MNEMEVARYGVEAKERARTYVEYRNKGLDDLAQVYLDLLKQNHYLDGLELDEAIEEAEDWHRRQQEKAQQEAEWDTDDTNDEL